jgi:hypothetical protein
MDLSDRPATGFVDHYDRHPPRRRRGDGRPSDLTSRVSKTTAKPVRGTAGSTQDRTRLPDAAAADHRRRISRTSAGGRSGQGDVKSVPAREPNSVLGANLTRQGRGGWGGWIRRPFLLATSCGSPRGPFVLHLVALSPLPRAGGVYLVRKRTRLSIVGLCADALRAPRRSRWTRSLLVWLE